ncbi:hypothetical protein J5X84_33765 [Streptosporangiaceae bacterium NEAU-GS5]|nr:hypothetical protein [Streptosporangiaceae bacterium NEAU-GS5]
MNLLRPLTDPVPTVGQTSALADGQKIPILRDGIPIFLSPRAAPTRRIDVRSSPRSHLLPGRRRHHLFGHHDPQPPRRMDQSRDLRAAQDHRLDSYDRIVGLLLEEIALDACITKAPAADRSPTDLLSIAASKG